MLTSVSITKNFVLLTVAAFVLILAGLFLSFFQTRAIMLDQKRSEIQHIVEAGATIFKGVLDKGKAAGLTDYDAMKEALEALRHARFEGTNYLFVLNLRGEMLLHPRKDLEGKNISDMKDKNGFLMVQDFIRTVRQHGKGFTEYYWKSPKATRKR